MDYTAKRSMPVTRPVGVLDPAPPKGCSCVESETKSFRNPKLGPTWLYLGPTWPSCRSCSSILSNLAPTWLQLGPSLLQLGPTFRQLGPTWSHLVPTWLHLGPILVPTWSNMVPKSDQDELQEVFSSLSKRSSVFH